MDSDIEVQNDGDATYRKLVLLDDLESLLEELEEQGIAEGGAMSGVPNDLRERMEELRVPSLTELRTRISELHHELDRED
ncbi:MAG TPA: hypothetical protein VEX13_07505 [Chloroflexia bacterium]|nr:hypothetical protein [Chloroflexia bacterium]